MVLSAGPKDFILRTGDPVVRFVYFISSGSDLNVQRDLFEGMVREVNQQFRNREDRARAFVLEVDRWEHDAPRRTTDMNEEFVRRARASHVTVVLLCEEVRSGTQEEIEGVLQEAGVQLSVIWMEKPEAKSKSRKLKKFLRDHEDRIAYHRTGPPGSPEAMLALFRVVAASLADLTRQDRLKELFSESR